jgi:Leucine-rich repeat (LRR) protein
MWSKALDGLNPTKIRTLSIRNLGNSNLGDSDCLTALIGFTALTELNLYGPRCAALDLRALEGLTALKTIDLSGTQSMLRDDEFISLAGLTNLTNLNLANCRKLSNRGFATLTCFTALTRLDLTGTRVNDEVILNHLTKLTALKWLVVSTQNYVPYYGPRISTGVIQQLALKLQDMVLISAPLPTVDQI